MPFPHLLLVNNVGDAALHLRVASETAHAVDHDAHQYGTLEGEIKVQALAWCVALAGRFPVGVKATPGLDHALVLAVGELR